MTPILKQSGKSPEVRMKFTIYHQKSGTFFMKAFKTSAGTISAGELELESDETVSIQHALSICLNKDHCSQALSDTFVNELSLSSKASIMSRIFFWKWTLKEFAREYVHDAAGNTLDLWLI